MRSQTKVDHTGSEPTVPFPPENFPAPFDRTAEDRDGNWSPLVDGTDSHAALYVARVHPNPIKKFVYVVIVALDLARVELHLAAGTEHADRLQNTSIVAGLVPTESQDRLIAVFNGGFKQAHGHYGIGIEGTELVTQRSNACTISFCADGHVAIHALERPHVDCKPTGTFRQTPRCLIEEGVFAPELATPASRRVWAGAVDGRMDVRRSALGTDRIGRIAYFALGEWVTPQDLARALRAAGIPNAAELDINWSYTRFILYRHATADHSAEVSATLIPELRHAKGEYTTRASSRDFFYVLDARGH